MTIGGSLLLIALGAILRFAVTAHVGGINLATVGTILMVVGAIGLVISLIWLASHRRPRTEAVTERRYTEPTERRYVEPTERRYVETTRNPDDPYRDAP